MVIPRMRLQRLWPRWPGQSSRWLWRPAAPAAACMGPVAEAPERVRDRASEATSTPNLPAKDGLHLLVVDNCPLRRQGLRALLEGVLRTDVALVAEASTGEEALQLALELRPDALVLNVYPPNRSLVEVTRILRARVPDVRLVVFTPTAHATAGAAAIAAMADGATAEGTVAVAPSAAATDRTGIAAATAYSAASAAQVRALAALGVQGLLAQTAGVEELAQALRAAWEGQRYVQPEVSVLLGEDQDTPAPVAGTTTPREREVLQLLALGLHDREIAQRLSIEPATVRYHLSNLFTKCGVSSRAALLRRAAEVGWLDSLD